MDYKREQALLKQLAGYKWGEDYCCVKCGNRQYIGGRKEFFRRCKKCRYDESLFKFTAFEGLRFPVLIAYQIIVRMFDKAYFNIEEPLISSSNGKISLADYIERCRHYKMPRERIDKNVVRIMKTYRPSVRGLSRDLGIEENSITRFLSKLEERIAPVDRCFGDSPYWNLIYHMADRDRFKNEDYYMSLAMVPFVGKWQQGEIRVKGKYYAVAYSPEKDQHSVFEINYSENMAGGLSRYVNYEHEIEYGSDKWCDVFDVNIDT